MLLSLKVTRKCKSANELVETGSGLPLSLAALAVKLLKPIPCDSARLTQERSPY
jgi:hypothetical protein